MPCYTPLLAERSAGGVRIIGALHDGMRFSGNLRLPCGQCIGCRLERSRQWAVRMVHESKEWPSNYFVTLTYDEANLPKYGSLVYAHYQEFMKVLRMNRWRKTERKLRFFCAGEYGSRSARPHYHAILFNLVLSDLHQVGADLFSSPLVDKLWGRGECKIGAVTPESAQYVAGYCVDKVTGAAAPAHYRVVVDYETGEMADIEPEFCHMSLKPGIGAKWMERFSSDVYPEGKVVFNGKKWLPPRYYDSLYARVCPDSMDTIRAQREVDGKSRAEDNTRARLVTRSTVARSNFARFERDF